MKVSLVVPLKDEISTIDRLVGSVMSQTRLPDEVIFVDAGSRDGTKTSLERYLGKSVNMMVLDIGTATPGKARNAGVRKAKHDAIAFTDGGIEIEKDWLKNLIVNMENTQADVVYGHYRPRTDSIFKESLAMVMMQPLVRVDGRWMRKRSIASSLMKRSAWEAAGGCPDARAGEDRVLMDKIDRIGLKVSYCPSAVMTWDIPANLAKVWRRFSTYSFHNAESGRIENWHMPVLRMYIGAAMLLLLGIFVWSGFLVALPLWFLVRVIKKIVQNRHEAYLRPSRLPLYILETAFLILFIDMAMFSGWLKSLRF